MTETGAAPHTLFIKQNCRYCALLRASLDDAGLMGDFAIVDVDVTPVNPQQVSHVPTIVADRQRAMSGRDAFAWAQDYINSSPQCMTSSSIGKCTGWESMSSTFAFIDGEADANVRTNTSMSAVYSSFDTDVGAVETDAGKIDDPLADAVANLQNERNAAFQAPRRA